MTIRRTLAAALAATAIAAPTASAVPADSHAPSARAQERPQQDLRSADAINASEHPRRAPVLLASPGHPSEAGNARPLPPLSSRVVKSDDGLDWATIGLGIAGALLAMGGIAALTSRRPVPRTRATA